MYKNATDRDEKPHAHLLKKCIKDEVPQHTVLRRTLRPVRIKSGKRRVRKRDKFKDVIRFAIEDSNSSLRRIKMWIPYSK